MTYKELRANGICPQCYKPNPTPDKSRCPECLKKMYLQRKHNRDYAAKHGFCTVCYKENILPGKLCPDCLEKASIYNSRITPQKMHEVYKRKKEKCDMNGLCIGCKKNPARPGHAYCVSCYVKIRRKQLRNVNTISRSERPNYGMCYICGGRLDNKSNICTKCRTRNKISFKGKD